MRQSCYKRGAMARLFALVLPVCAAVSACTLDYGRRAVHDTLGQAGVVATHEVIRSADWTLNHRTALCLLPSSAIGPEARKYTARVDRALQAALRETFMVEPIANADAYTTAHGTCGLWVEPTVLDVRPALVRQRHASAGAGGAGLAARLVVRVTLRDAQNAGVLDVGVVQSAAGAVTPVASLPEAFITDAMRAYVARVAAVPAG